MMYPRLMTTAFPETTLCHRPSCSGLRSRQNCCSKLFLCRRHYPVNADISTLQTSSPEAGQDAASGGEREAPKYALERRRQDVVKTSVRHTGACTKKLRRQCAS